MASACIEMPRKKVDVSDHGKADVLRNSVDQVKRHRATDSMFEELQQPHGGGGGSGGKAIRNILQSGVKLKEKIRHS